MADPIVYIEILAHDLGQSSKFYSELFGWQLQPWNESYMMFEAGTGPGGALMSAPEHSQPVLPYIQVDDIEAVLSMAQSAGGVVLAPKRQISPEIGYSAILADPAGNKIGLFSKQ